MSGSLPGQQSVGLGYILLISELVITKSAVLQVVLKLGGKAGGGGANSLTSLQCRYLKYFCGVTAIPPSPSLCSVNHLRGAECHLVAQIKLFLHQPQNNLDGTKLSALHSC